MNIAPDLQDYNRWRDDLTVEGMTNAERVEEMGRRHEAMSGFNTDPNAIITKPTSLFVYGTLQRGCGNHRLLEGCFQRVTPARFLTRARLYDSGFPIMAVDPANSQAEAVEIVGELYEGVTPEAVSRCDGLEGHPNWYIRAAVPIRALPCGEAAGRVVPAWTYFMPFKRVHSSEIIPGHDWAAFNRPRR